MNQVPVVQYCEYHTVEEFLRAISYGGAVKSLKHDYYLYSER